MGTRPRLLAATISLALLGAAALTGPSTAAAPDPSKGSVSIKVANPLVLAGDPVRFSGVVTPKRAGLKVRLQKRVGSGWRSLAQTRTTAGGRYRLSDAQEFGGTYQYRVVRLPWLTSSAKSRVVTVQAYVWNAVSDMVQPGDWDSGVQFPDLESIDGVLYQDPIVMDADSQGTVDGGFFEVDLAGLGCAAFDTTAGAVDNNAGGSRVGIEVKADGASLKKRSFAPGESEQLILDVRGADVLRVESQVVLAGPQGKLGLGNPRMLCAS